MNSADNHPARRVGRRHGPIEEAVRRYEITQAPRLPFVEPIADMKSRIERESNAALGLIMTQGGSDEAD